MIFHTTDTSGELWWCKSHGRRATHIDRYGEHCCAPEFGGILLPCVAVNLTGLVEITEVTDNTVLVESLNEVREGVQKQVMNQ